MHAFVGTGILWELLPLFGAWVSSTFGLLLLCVLALLGRKEAAVQCSQYTRQELVVPASYRRFHYSSLFSRHLNHYYVLFLRILLAPKSLLSPFSGKRGTVFHGS